MERRLILWLDEVSKDLVPLVGGKAAGLGEMIKAGIPVPPGLLLPVRLTGGSCSRPV